MTAATVRPKTVARRIRWEVSAVAPTMGCSVTAGLWPTWLNRSPDDNDAGASGRTATTGRRHGTRAARGLNLVRPGPEGGRSWCRPGRRRAGVGAIARRVPRVLVPAVTGVVGVPGVLVLATGVVGVPGVLV